MAFRLATFLTVVLAAHVACTGAPAAPTPGSAVRGLVHESRPTTATPIQDAIIEVEGGPLGGQVFRTDATGRFELPAVRPSRFVLRIRKPGYEDGRHEVVLLPGDQTVDIALAPERRTVRRGASAANSCEATPPCSGLPLCIEREPRLSFAVHHDGFFELLAVTNPNWVQRQYLVQRGPNGEVVTFWNDLTGGARVGVPIAIAGGYFYELLLWGSNSTLCGPFQAAWTHPS